MLPATTPSGCSFAPRIGAVMIQSIPSFATTTGPIVSTLRLLANVPPDGVAERLIPGTDDATTWPFKSKIWSSSKNGCDVAALRSWDWRSGDAIASFWSCARVRSSAWRSDTHSVIRTAALCAVASARALVWSMLICALQVAITKPRTMERGLDTRRIHGTNHREY